MIKKRELKSIQELDELSLYLEINKYQTMLVNLKNDVLTNISDEKIAGVKELEIRKALATYLESVIRFGIDPTNKENLNEWISACSTYINNMDVIEHIMFVQQRKDEKKLDAFGTSLYGESAFLKKQENLKIKEQKIV